MDCPKCGVGKLSEVTVRLQDLKPEQLKAFQAAGRKPELTLDQCFACRGIWFDAGELEEYLKYDTWAMDGEEAGADLEKQLDAKIAK